MMSILKISDNIFKSQEYFLNPWEKIFTRINIASLTIQVLEFTIIISVSLIY